MKCFRCGSFDHRKDACTIERCLECGQFGHSMRVCTKPYSLPKSEKERVRKSELSHKLLMQRSQETQRRKQLGEHAKEAPVIQATSRSPSPKHDKTALKHPQPNPKKRPRESSPPFDAPKGPKLSKSKYHKTVTNSNRPSQGRDIEFGGGAQKQSLPLRSPTDNSFPRYDLAGREPSDLLNSKPSSKPYQRDSLPQPEPNPYPSSTKYASNDIKPPAISNKPHVKPPSKKRRDANPLLIPNRKPRR